VQDFRAAQRHLGQQAQYGTVAQAVRRCGLRRSHYERQAKTHLNYLMIATSLNLMRMIAWLMEVPLAKTRISPLGVFRQNSAPIIAAT
jgi:hypothetical protein